jgi:hypothetical protein
MVILRHIWRGVQHLMWIASAAIVPDQRQQMRALLGILRHSRAPLREAGLPGLMRFLDQQADDQPFVNSAAIPQADALAALLPMRPFRHCMKRAILRYVILKSQGQAASFQIGVERPDRTVLKGHAWVAVEGIAFREDDDQYQHMIPIFCYPSG